MAVKRKSDDPEFDPAESTDNVSFDDSPILWGIVTDNTSTGAVKTPKPETIVAPWHGADAVLNIPTPGPVTVRVSWKPETKVVGPLTETKTADPSPVAETK